jgi:small subunit ribosomal protein S17
MAKTLYGVVSSDKGNKTIVITIRTRKTHPLYKKQYTVSKRLMAHDENNEAHIGDKVAISETRPISAQKHFMLTKIIERPAIREDQSVETVTKEEIELTPEVKKLVKPTAVSKAVKKPARKTNITKPNADKREES